MCVCKTFQADRKFHIAAAYDVLDFEGAKPGWEAELLNDTGVLARCKSCLFLSESKADKLIKRSPVPRRGRLTLWRPSQPSSRY